MSHAEDLQRRLAAEREKKRMQALNDAFDELRQKLRVNKGKRVPKIKTLR